MNKLLAILICVLLAPVNAWAETAACRGKVTHFGQWRLAPGVFFVQLDTTSKNFAVCSFNEVFLNATPAACRNIASVTTTAFAMGKSLVIYVENAPTTNCAEIPAQFQADVSAYYVEPN